MQLLLNNKRYLQLIIFCICLNFIVDNLFLKFVIGIILGFKRDEFIVLKAFILGLVSGIEISFISIEFSSSSGFSSLLSFFHIVSFPIVNSFGYSIVRVFSIILAVIGEIIIFVVVAYIGFWIRHFLNSRGYHLYW